MEKFNQMETSLQWHLLALAAPRMASGVLSCALREGDGHLASSCLSLILSGREDINHLAITFTFYTSNNCSISRTKGLFCVLNKLTLGHKVKKHSIIFAFQTSMLHCFFLTVCLSERTLWQLEHNPPTIKREEWKRIVGGLSFIVK